MEGGPITTVVPATTASALTSITTGLAPAQHGILGYRMLVGGEVLNVLRWSVHGGGRPPDPFDVQRHTAFLGRPVPVVTKSEFRTTGFTEAHLRGGRFVGWHTTAALVEHCLRRGRVAASGSCTRTTRVSIPSRTSSGSAIAVCDARARARRRDRRRVARRAARRAPRCS